MTLFAHETEFWLLLYWNNISTADAEWRYHANAPEMTECYSSNFFPPIVVEPDMYD